MVGATTATVLDVRGAPADRDAVWRSASASLDNFAGQIVRIVIQAADAGTGSLVEAAVDDVRISRL